MRVHRLTIASGQRGIRQTVRVMTSLAMSASQDPVVIRTAREVAGTAPEGDTHAEFSAIEDYVRSNLRFTGDPRSAEHLTDPALLVREIEGGVQAYGDCDEYVTLIASMAIAVGIPVRFVTRGETPEGPHAHVYMQYMDRATGVWTAADPIVRRTWDTALHGYSVPGAASVDFYATLGAPPRRPSRRRGRRRSRFLGGLTQAQGERSGLVNLQLPGVADIFVAHYPGLGGLTQARGERSGLVNVQLPRVRDLAVGWYPGLGDYVPGWWRWTGTAWMSTYGTLLPYPPAEPGPVAISVAGGRDILYPSYEAAVAAASGAVVPEDRVVPTPSILGPGATSIYPSVPSPAGPAAEKPPFPWAVVVAGVAIGLAVRSLSRRRR